MTPSPTPRFRPSFAPDPTPAPVLAPVPLRRETTATAWRRRAPGLVVAAVVAAAVLAALDLWSRRPSMLVPRHRAEAVCFALEQEAKEFTPPMVIEPSAAMVRGRFAARTPVMTALAEAMQFTDAMVLRHWLQRIGDYDVAAVWLRVPQEGGRHWLIVGWMEGADLAVCNFRFPGNDPDLTADETSWGDELLDRILVDRNFRSAALPSVRMRATADGRLPPLGPKPDR